MSDQNLPESTVENTTEEQQTAAPVAEKKTKKRKKTITLNEVMDTETPEEGNPFSSETPTAPEPDPDDALPSLDASFDEFTDPAENGNPFLSEENAPAASEETAIKESDENAQNGAEKTLSAEENIPAIPEETTTEAEAPAKHLSRRKRRKLKKKQKKERFLHVTLDNDIRYRGPLSYRTLRILAWFLLFISQVGTILSFFGSYDAGIQERFGILATVFRLFSGSLTPLFLIASFAMLLNRSRKYSQQIRNYALAAVVVILLYNLIYYRYIIGIFARATASSAEEAESLFALLLSMIQKGSNFFACNIFIDLFLCSLFVTFLFYVPKKVFVGKKLIIFRLFALLPVFYELSSIAIKFFANFGNLDLPAAVGPFLTTKPALTFVLFIALALYVKIKEMKYVKAGKTLEEFHSYVMSNHNSLYFSKFAVKMILLIFVADFILSISLGGALSVGEAAAAGLDPSDPEITALVTNKLMACGIGKSMSLIFAVPFLLLFSYTRSHDNTIIDIAIPIIAIAFLILLFLEAGYQASARVPDLLGDAMGGMMGGGE